jgi:hypothetical protein
MKSEEAFLHRDVVTNKQTGVDDTGKPIDKGRRGQIIEVNRPDGTVRVHFDKHPGVIYCKPEDLDEYPREQPPKARPR